jgi:hypothetical protein
LWWPLNALIPVSALLCIDMDLFFFFNHVLISKKE